MQSENNDVQMMFNLGVQIIPVLSLAPTYTDNNPRPVIRTH